MATTQDQIDAMREFCGTLEQESLIKEARVDDWGRDGNFQIIVTPHEHNRTTGSRLCALVRRNLPKGACMREAFGPDPIREWNPYTRKYKTRGYQRSFWVVDIDYQIYDANSNRFSEGNVHVQ